MLCSSMATPFSTNTFFLITLCCFFLFTIPMATPRSQDTLKPHQPFFNNTTLISANKRFELGFFSPSLNLTNISYLGIWYKDITPLTVVWVANRMEPLEKSNASLVLDNHGRLAIQDGFRNIWRAVAKVKKAVIVRPTLQLLDSGNLVVRDSGGNNGKVGGYIWESFDYPTDTLLPGMKLGWDFVAGLDRVMTSWKNNDDPSDGEYSFGFNSPVSQQLVLVKDLVFLFRWGPWDGSRFSGTNAFISNDVYKPLFISNPTELSFTFEVLDDMLLRFTLTSEGYLKLLHWKSDTKKWAQMVMLNKDYCDHYSLCGPNGVCHLNEPNCQCLEGFEPSLPHEWDRMDFTGGCKRKNHLNCSGGGDGFIKYGEMKLPDFSAVWTNLSPDECGEKCLKECGCMAYTNLDLYGNGSQCVVWKGDHLVDIRHFRNGGDDIYIRMPQLDVESINHPKKEKPGLVEIAIFLCLFFAIFCLSYVTWHVCLTSNAAYRQAELSNNQNRRSIESHEEDFDFHTFDIDTLSAATNFFSLSNKLGQGGFGIVYKGELGRGHKIAVKRLTRNPLQENSQSQGFQEFENEVSLIARLQHRNLVKLLGYCIEGEERLLVYEYLPNGSLDHLLFDEASRRQLTWEKRLHIITEVAKGLVYLHDDSRLRVIHRDLKASNILLDNEMNPKISDFGLARISVDEVQETTRRFGTNGYMAPEYVMSGQFSTRSDVFSFGVLALELISGKKNWGFQHPDHDMNLLGHAWKLWAEDRPMELIDTELEVDSFSESEMFRCIQVSLLCVQQRASDRPTMSSVINMLRNEGVIVPKPREPFFLGGRSSSDLGLGMLSSRREPLEYESFNELTISTLSGR